MKLLFSLVVLLSVTAIFDANNKRNKKDPFEFSSASIDYYDPSYFGYSSTEYLFSSMEYKFTKLKLHGNVRQRFALEAVRIFPRSNVICSPISALMPLGKLVFGARGYTQYELLEALGIKSRDKTEKDFKKVIRSLKKLKGVTLTIASQLFVGQSEIDSKFKSQAMSVFNSVVETVNFNNRVDAANQINRWVSQKTDGMIRQIISPNDITSRSSVIVANAVYFSGQWKYKFRNTGSSNFFSSNGISRVSMMTVTEKFNYVQSDSLDSQVVKIPYQKGKVSFVIVLPNKRDGLAHLLNTIKLVPDMLNSALKRMTKQNVVITMPKFKIETAINLKDVYNQLNVRRIFSPEQSELSSIIRTGTVFVSSAIQKAIIEVNEFGTEASATSVVQMEILSTQIFKDPKIFYADHPFLFYIIGKDEQLFAGSFNK